MGLIGRSSKLLVLELFGQTRFHSPLYDDSPSLIEESPVSAKVLFIDSDSKLWLEVEASSLSVDGPLLLERKPRSFDMATLWLLDVPDPSSRPEPAVAAAASWFACTLDCSMYCLNLSFCSTARRNRHFVQHRFLDKSHLLHKGP